MAAVQYNHLDYESYKKLENQMRTFAETSHKTEGGFYHKSIRLEISPGFIMEFHGPLVGGYGHLGGPAGENYFVRELAAPELSERSAG